MFDKYYVLVTKGSCPVCQEAIEFLKTKELDFVYTDMEHAPRVLEAAKAGSGHSTVPIIWETNMASSKFVGGFDDLQESLEGDSEMSE